MTGKIGTVFFREFGRTRRGVRTLPLPRANMSEASDLKLRGICRTVWNQRVNRENFGW